MKTTKRMLSILLSLMLTLTGLAALCVPANAVYKVGSTLYYGSYPQAEVTDSLGSTLNSLSDAAHAASSSTWTSYDYTCTDGNKDSMKYKDVDYNGAKYRGVFIKANRVSYGYSNTQKDNGYIKENVYWFKWEPLQWRVLDPSAGFILCATAIDSQPFNNSSSSNYAKSAIRIWLNQDFYNAAFSATEKAAIQTTSLENKSIVSADYDAGTTNDKVFLLSYAEATNNTYGFRSDPETIDLARLVEGSDYAKCQGLWYCKDIYSEVEGYSCWWLRTPYTPPFACEVDHDGRIFMDDVFHNNFGVCPAMKIGNLNAGVALKSIAVKTMPSKTVYAIGEPFSQSGLTLTATYSDGSTETVTSGFTCSGFDSATAGTKAITVTYQGKTTTFTVAVQPESGSLTGIAIKALPSKTVYTYRNDKNLKLDGLEIEATYSDGSKLPVDPAECTITGYSAKPVGTKTITVAYEGLTAQFNVTVKYAWWQWIIRILLLGFLWY